MQPQPACTPPPGAPNAGDGVERLALTARQEMRQRMEALRDELGGGTAQWSVEGQIGKGAFGVVYKVRC